MQQQRLVNAGIVQRTARAVLAVDMSDVVLRDFVPQVAVGLCRAGAAQSIVVATLTRAGQASAAAPNRRLVLESAIRLIWLSGLSKADRHTAASVMLEADRKETNDTLNYLEQQGQKAPFDPTEMNAFELDAPTKGLIQEQARKLRAAVVGSESEPWSLYAMWREETKYSHPSGALAGQYAPTHDDSHLHSGHPDPTDPDLEAHQLIQCLIVAATQRILEGEGLTPEAAARITKAFSAQSPYAFEWPG
ncbi:hypothetical protein [Microbacterium wangruii]|uniref:hypothetical protein n=1 Tax=Microbacterium wangruii TaxID=3049073 RepID=UPI00256F2182|nr:hypothetical protein [Microbacterium sp. zg-Y1211]MDL5488167.1 hypothetical protein [Microbacterium sp. zg-Y1211]